jgi:hypothetical protein
MKIFKKLFLASTFFIISNANFLGAMDDGSTNNADLGSLTNQMGNIDLNENPTNTTSSSTTSDQIDVITTQMAQANLREEDDMDIIPESELYHPPIIQSNEEQPKEND